MHCSFWSIAILAVLIVPVRTAQAQQGPYIYIPNNGTNDVSVIDSSTNTVAPATIATGGTGPQSAAVRADESFLYVTNQITNNLSVIDTATNTVKATIAVGNSPLGVAITPDGKTLYVANQNSDTVSIINAATNTVVSTVSVGTTPVGVAFSSDGKTGYVSNFASNDVSVISTATNTVIATIPVGTNPFAVALTPDGAKAYVTNFTTNTVSVIDTSTNTVTATLPVGTNPIGVAATPDGQHVYVVDNNSNQFSVIDTATNTVTTFNAGNHPRGITFSPDGKFAYMTNFGNNTVSVIDTTSNIVLTTLAAGTAPFLPGACANGNALLGTGLTFKANTSGALACTLASVPSGSVGPVFSGGTLQFAAAGITSSFPISLQSSGGIFDTSGNNATLSGTVSGTGNLSKIGLGTLTLSGAQTYFGATFVNAGTLQGGAPNVFSPSSAFTVAAGAVLSLNNFNQTIGSLAGAGNVALGSATLTTNGDNTSTTFSGTISGTGGVSKVGNGTLTLTGNNTYQGGTSLNSGSLGVGSNTALGTAALTFTNGTKLQAAIGAVSLANAMVLNGSDTIDTQGNQLVLTGALSGAGGFTKSGTGTLTLTGTNTYSGGTTINAGTLALNGIGTLGAAGGATTVVSGTLDLGATTQTQNGGVTLTSGVVKNGTLSSSGVFLLQSGAVSAALAGSGGLTKATLGTVVLTGINSYVGATAINGGTLEVDGAIAASSGVTINAGGTLSGTGTIGSSSKVMVSSGANFAPGNGMPQSSLTIAGNLAFQSGAVYLVQINPATSSVANVTGTASLAGTVTATFAPGRYLTNTYTILHSAGLGGTTFSALSTTNQPVGITTSLSYSSTDVFLKVIASLGAPGENGNQQNVATSINTFFNNGGTLPPNFLALFGLTGDALGNALTRLSGEVATDAQSGAFNLTNQFLNLMLDPFVDGRSATGWPGKGAGAMGFAPDRTNVELPANLALAYAKAVKAPSAAAAFEQRWSVWGSGFGAGSTIKGDPVVGSNDVRAADYGFAGGFDYHWSPDVVAGFALSGGGTNWALAQGLGSGRSDAFQAGVYGAAHFDAGYVAAALAFANHWMTSDRASFALNQLHAAFQGQNYSGRIESGYRFATFPSIGITPYVALQAQVFNTPNYDETDVTAGGFGLSYVARSATARRSEVGARFDSTTMISAIPLSLRARLAWAHDWSSDAAITAIFQALPGTAFVVNGAMPAKDLALVSAGVELHISRNLSLTAKFDGESAAHSQTYAGTGTVRYVW